MIHAPLSECIRSASSHRILHLLREADTDKMELIGSLRRLLSQNALKDIQLSQPLELPFFDPFKSHTKHHNSNDISPLCYKKHY